MIRTRTTTWIVQVHNDAGQWVPAENGETTRFADAIRTYDALDTDQKRLLRNGRPLRIRTDPNTELDLFLEG